MKDNKQREVVYCLRYALTQGIILATGHEQLFGRFMYVTYWFLSDDNGYFDILEEGEWTRDAAEALELARGMRNKRIEELESLRFDLPAPGATLVGRYADNDLEVPNDK